uniref:EGF-like domain-containing protein n=1 Tax=Anas zonorhyncha TaxID=75864 RepID=A0A8B9UCZ6_9AVES
MRVLSPLSPSSPSSPLSAVLMECCARLCPALGSGTGSTLGTATPCAHRGNGTGERCRTDPQQGAGAGQLPTPKATTWLQTEAELLPFPGTPPGTAEPPSTERGGWTSSEGTGPAGGHGAGTGAGPPLAMGAAEAATGSQGPSPASLGRGLGGGPSAAPMELDPAPTTSPSLRTEPVGDEMVEGATAPLGTLLHSPSSVTVPSPTGEHWETPSALPGQSPTGTAPAQSQGGSPSSLHPEPGAREGLGATAPLGDSSPGTHQSSAAATGSPGPGTTGTSPSGGGLQRLLSSLGTLGEAAGGRGAESHPWHGTDAAWQGPRAASRPSPPSLGAGGHGGPMWQPGDPTASTAQPAAGTGPGLPVPTAMASTPGVTSPSQEGALALTVGVSGPPNTEGPPEPRRIPLHQTWPSVAPGSSMVVPSGVPRGSPTSPQPTPATSSAAAPSPTLQPSPGLGPTAGTPPAGSPGPGLPHTGSGGHRAESPLTLGVTPEGVVDGELWAATAQPSWQPGSLAPPTAPAPHPQPAPSQPASSLGAATTASAAATPSPALPGDMGTVTPEPSAGVWKGGVEGLTWGPSVVPGPPQQPTDSSETLGHHGGSASPPSPGGTDLGQAPSSPGERLDAEAPGPTAEPAPAGRAPRVFIVEDQPPLLRASLLRVPCELVLDMGFVPALQDPASRERRGLLHSFNRTVAPLFMSVPGFLRLEVTGIREGSVVLEYDALFAAERVRAPGLGALLESALGPGGTRPGLAVGAAPVLRNVALERPLDPCAELFACRAGFACVAGADGNATCTSLCHRDYCKNHGICTHPRDRGPLCQCPVGSDFWFMGLRCDYRVTQQSLLGMALGVLFSIVLLGAVVAGLVIRRFKALLLEARADQTRSRWGLCGDGVGMGGAEWWWGLCACPQHRQSSSFGSTVVGRWLCWPCCPSHGCVVPLWGLALWKGPRDRGQRVFGGREQGWGLGSCPAGCSHNLGGDTRSVPAVGSAGSCGGTAGPGAAVTARPRPAATGASAGWTTSRPSTGRAPGWPQPAPWTTRPSPTRRSCCTCRSWTTAAAAAARPRPLAAAPSSAPRPPPTPRTGPGSAWHRHARLLGIYQQGCGQPRSILLPPGGNNCGWVVVFCLPSTGSFVFRVWWSCCRAHSCSKKRVAAGVCV